MIGRDLKFAGSGYGGDLLIDCFTRIARISDDIGTAIVMLDVLIAVMQSGPRDE
ncbi:hypothetical protein ACOJBO_13165 [Rhizobium beringeri]